MTGKEKIPYFTIEDKKSKEIYKLRIENDKMICMTCPNNVTSCIHLYKFVSSKEIMDNVKNFIGITQPMINDVKKNTKERKYY